MNEVFHYCKQHLDNHDGRRNPVTLILYLATIGLLIAKISGKVKISWFVVFLPMLVSFLLCVGVLLVFYILAHV